MEEAWSSSREGFHAAPVAAAAARVRRRRGGAAALRLLLLTGATAHRCHVRERHGQGHDQRLGRRVLCRLVHARTRRHMQRSCPSAPSLQMCCGN
eukprot:4482944-Pleurochrysis_carterae.AAC.3